MTTDTLKLPSAAGTVDNSAKLSKPTEPTITNGTTTTNGNGETSKDSEKPEEPATPVGSISKVKNIYGKKDKDNKWSWGDKIPEDVEEAAENKESAKFAVVVRNIKSQDSRRKLEAESIIVQSPWLKAALSEILKDYPGVACELKRLVFEAPFKPFVHRWAEFSAYCKRDDLDPITSEHLNVLNDILEDEIGETIKAFEDYVAHGVVTFEHLWLIYQPGAVVLAAHKGPLSAFELDESEYMENQCGKFLRLRTDCVDYGGSNFGRFRASIDIPQFIGTKKITGLNAYPLSFDENQDMVVKTLIARGMLFERLAGHHYKAYSGTAITWDREGNEVPITVDGRIVIDIKSFNRFSPYRTRRLRDWTPLDQKRFAAHKEQSGSSSKEGLQLTPYHHMLATSRTRGYSLKLKQWLDFFVESVEEIVWNSNAFDQLVLPEDQKELILAFSESQLQGANFDDVISGKGKGIICLLSGPPGVGKTLSAEAVAETLQVPLHTLSSGDLGSQPWEVENGLQKILDLVSRWNAILLLDECDVFLEERSTHDLERNKVVSIFLRTLEYYEGILFLTTNRVKNLDPAFQSRIHVSLEYPNLTAASRRQIWANFLAGAARRAGAARSELLDTDLDELASLDLNGRQIKNILKTAQLLASRRKAPLRREFIDTVLKIEKRRPVA